MGRYRPDAAGSFVRWCWPVSFGLACCRKRKSAQIAERSALRSIVRGVTVHSAPNACPIRRWHISQKGTNQVYLYNGASAAGQINGSTHSAFSRACRTSWTPMKQSSTFHSAPTIPAARLTWRPIGGSRSSNFSTSNGGAGGGRNERRPQGEN